ncbi:MAG TPA: TonB-dependent receptor [Vicinamibacterales bacterium]|jgi:outer membrane receptor protein involved in Fe transport|nr:TonB-dependent receptor [Vicinamibacterales bacterium]
MQKVLVLIFCLALPMTALGQGTVKGVVRDATGLVVSGAAISVQTASGVEQHAVTGPDGRFELARGIPSGAKLVVRAGGFAEKTQAIAESSSEIEVVLQPARLLESVTVTPTRTEQRLGDVAASTHVIDQEEIRHSPAVMADDVLRTVPTFSLFRRTSSLSAHPSAQGVSLRSIGPSGVSRSLVLIDGVPFNEPFSGWVYWSRIPLESVDRIELIDGASSSIWGNYALGGVINVVTTRPKPRTVEFRSQAGTRDTWKADFFGSQTFGKLGVSLEGSFFDTGGFEQVIAEERGPIDTKARVNYENVAFKADYSPSDRISTFLRLGYFREERDNAKVTTFAPTTPEANDTLWKAFSAGVRTALPDQSDLQASVFLDFSRFDSNFLAVPTPRSVARVSTIQHVPTDAVGGLVQWSKAISTKYLVSAGTDFRHIKGATEEQGMNPTNGLTVATVRDGRGTQISSGTFVQVQYLPIPKLSLTASGRADHWRNYNAHYIETTVATGLPAARNLGDLADKDETVFNPKFAALYHVTDKVTAWGSIGTGFRAPTLNELYRNFSVGQLLTLGNAALGPERLRGGELGVSVAPTDDLSVRGTWFDNRMKDPIATITLTPNTLAQRQNIGRTRIRGFQTDVEYRFGQQWRAAAGYVLNDAKITENPSDTSLVGKFLQQVPKNRGSLSVSYINPRLADVTMSALFVGHQFDDDQNVKAKTGEEPGLPAYGVVDLSVLRALGRNLDVFVTVQNMFDKEYWVQLQPTTIAAPRLVNVGLRVRWSGR